MSKNAIFELIERLFVYGLIKVDPFFHIPCKAKRSLILSYILIEVCSFFINAFKVFWYIPARKFK